VTSLTAAEDQSGVEIDNDDDDDDDSGRSGDDF